MTNSTKNLKKQKYLSEYFVVKSMFVDHHGKTVIIMYPISICENKRVISFIFLCFSFSEFLTC